MKNLILTTAVILGSLAPAYADNASEAFIQHLASSDDGADRFLARQLEKGAVSPSGTTFSSKSGTVDYGIVETLAASDDGAERKLADDILAGVVSGTNLSVQTVDTAFVAELASSDDGADRALARHLINSGAVAN